MATQFNNETDEMVMTCDICGNDELFYGDFKSCIAQSKEKGWKTFKEDEKWCNKCPSHEADEPVTKPSKPKMELPSVGRIVHYVDKDENHRAAIITDLNAFSGNCDLQLFPVTEGFVTDIEMNSQAAKYTWHWPERS